MTDLDRFLLCSVVVVCVVCLIAYWLWTEPEEDEVPVEVDSNPVGVLKSPANVSPKEWEQHDEPVSPYMQMPKCPDPSPSMMPMGFPVMKPYRLYEEKVVDSKPAAESVVAEPASGPRVSASEVALVEPTSVASVPVKAAPAKVAKKKATAKKASKKKVKPC